MKYTELMDKVTVTEDMRERVLANVERELARPARRRVSIKRVAALAACLVLVIVAAVTATSQMNPGVVQVPGIETVQDASALSETVGYQVSDVSSLPFEPDTAVYTAYEDMAEIDYSGDGERAVYRRSPGNEDNSGDYNEYAAVTSLNAGDAQITLKGDAQDSYTLALWSADGYSYSLSLTMPMTESEWLELIEANLQ